MYEKRLFAFDAQPFFFARIRFAFQFARSVSASLPMPLMSLIPLMPLMPLVHYWLIKSEPDEVSFDGVMAASARTLAWSGVRNYQARNFMRDQMAAGDGVLFYHSSCAQPGVAGIAEVASAAYPDQSQFEADGKYFDPKATRETPRWISVDVRALEQGRYLPLAEMRAMTELEDMVMLQKGSRLSITPVTAGQWQAILKRLRKLK